MVGFPKKTWDWAEKIKKKVMQEVEEKSDMLLPIVVGVSREGIEIAMHKDLEEMLEKKQAGPTKTDIAEAIYYGLRHKYSFMDALEKDTYAQWPHEADSSVCFTQGLINHPVMAVCGLEPRIFEVRDLKKRDSNFISSHSINIGYVDNDEPWIIDQCGQRLGKVELDNKGKVITIENQAKGKTEQCSFSGITEFSEEDIAERMAYFKSKQGKATFLIERQRLGHPKVDRWKSQNSFESPWYVGYDLDTNELEIVVGFPRYLIQSRGIKACTILDEKRNIADEVIRGFYFSDIGWADFVNSKLLFESPVPMFSEVLQTLRDIPSEEHTEFEEKMMHLMKKDTVTGEDKKLKQIIVESFHRISHSRYRNVMRQYTIVEALYQERRTGSFVYSEKEIIKNLQKMRRQYPDIHDYLRVKKILDQVKKERQKAQFRAKRAMKTLQNLENGAAINIKRFGKLLNKVRRETEHVLRYEMLDNRMDYLHHMLKKQPGYHNDVLDRRVFVEQEVVGHASDLDTLETYARSRIDGDFETNLKVAYARIASEFMIQAANAWKELQLEPHKKKMLQNIKSYRPMILH